MAAIVDSTSSCSASARKPTWPRLTPSSGVLVAWVSSAARRIEPSPPMTSTSSQPSPGTSSGRVVSTSPSSVGSGPRSAASSASSRTAMPWRGQALDARPGHVPRLGPAGVGEHQDAALGTVGSLTGPPSHPPPPSTRRARPRRGSRPHRSRPDRGAAGGRTDVAGGSGERADRDGDGAPAALGGEVGDRGDRLGPQREVTDHPALADALLADLELRLDHQRQRRRPRGSRTAAGRAPGRGR